MKIILNGILMNSLQSGTTAAPPLTDREHDLASGRLVLRALYARLESNPGAVFLAGRAAAEVQGMEPGASRQALQRAVAELTSSGREIRALSDALVCWGAIVERRQRRDDAVRVYQAALALRPTDPALMLHLARSHRLAGDREAALDLYLRVRDCDEPRLRRFAALGQALLAGAVAQALGVVLAEAEAAGDREVAAVALEERARLQQRSGRAAAAVADYEGAAARFHDRRDRLRVALALADLLLARGDFGGARRTLVAALDVASPRERGPLVQRLRSIAFAEGDEVSLRRWPPAGVPAESRGPDVVRHRFPGRSVESHQTLSE